MICVLLSTQLKDVEEEEQEEGAEEEEGQEEEEAAKAAHKNVRWIWNRKFTGEIQLKCVKHFAQLLPASSIKCLVYDTPPSTPSYERPLTPLWPPFGRLCLMQFDNSCDFCMLLTALPALATLPSKVALQQQLNLNSASSQRKFNCSFSVPFPVEVWIPFLVQLHLSCCSFDVSLLLCFWFITTICVYKLLLILVTHGV